MKSLAEMRDRVLGLFREEDQSYDAKQQAIRDALGELVKAKPTLGSDAYAYVVDVFDDYCIFSADLDGDGDRDLYKINYTIGTDGEAEFSGDPVQVKKTTTYEPVTDDEAGESKRVQPAETLAEVELSELTMLTEKAIKADGSALIKIIQPGWGSSGYYGKTMLERDGPKAFGAGTKMYLDHPTKTEERERPERSVTNLGAELTGAASYLEGAKAPRGDGLYAPAKIFTAHREMLEDLAPHIGVSIRALGRTGAKPETIDGRTGPVIEQLVSAKSIDFVTEPGAGGEIVSLFESARGGAAYHRPIVKEVTAPRAEKETTVAENDKDVATQLAEARKQLAEQGTQIARLQEGRILDVARDFAIAAVARVRLPGMTKARIVEAVCGDPPTKDGALDRDAFTKVIAEAVKSEADYLVKVTGRGSIRGLGASASETVDQTKVGDAAKEDLKESFKTLGLTDKMADRAVAVRN